MKFCSSCPLSPIPDNFVCSERLLLCSGERKGKCGLSVCRIRSIVRKTSAWLRLLADGSFQQRQLISRESCVGTASLLDRIRVEGSTVLEAL